jgi:hypothetical protein
MQNQIRIKQPFSERYTLIIESDMMAVNVVMKSKTQIRWDFRVLEVNESKLEVELLLLDNILLESNNPLIKEISGMNQVFGRMYNELHLIIDHKGKIAEILNMDLILNKWEQTKKEMQTITNSSPELKDVISLNDSIFQNRDKLKAGIQGNEFFMIYFNEVYANQLPFRKSNVFKNNFFNTINIPFEYNVRMEADYVKQPSGTLDVFLNASPSSQPGKDFNLQAYKQFADKIDVSKLSTTLNETGAYEIDGQTGKLLKAELQRNEIADIDKLFTKMTYILTADSLYSKKNNDDATEMKEVIFEKKKSRIFS